VFPLDSPTAGKGASKRDSAEMLHACELKPGGDPDGEEC
jgi:hypothetical protein